MHSAINIIRRFITPELSETEGKINIKHMKHIKSGVTP